MKIYTKSGDKGHTQVYVDKPVRVTKCDAVIEVYGALDELNAHIGLLCSSYSDDIDTQQKLQTIQRAIFESGYALSASSKLTTADIDSLEQDIDRMTAEIAPQTAFILPGGSSTASQAHVCRTVCRRAERTLVSLQQEQDISEIVLAYINRLSDWLFVFARWTNHHNGNLDVLVR